MKKILFVISQLYAGGAETSLVNLLNRLDYRRYSVELLILNQVPIKSAVSLIDKVNSRVAVCDAYHEQNHILNRIKGKVLYTELQRTKFPLAALEFVRGKRYDWAFHIGEWNSPEFVAMEVMAYQKAAWIHNDLSHAEYFDEGEYFTYFDRFDKFIFVSEHSLISSIKKYPFLEKKALTIYNINDVSYIRQQAKIPLAAKMRYDKPVLLTCANVRPQKNHLRQLEVMRELKNRGVDVVWINIGSTADINLVSKIREKCKEYGLEKEFLLLGSKENPYQFIENADFITVLSDYESWSMVITEAKILGKIVVSTKTSGALEQIEHNKTGILVDFNVTSIADEIEKIVRDSNLRKSIERNINNFDNTEQIIESFDSLIESKTNSDLDLLYVIDDINYLGGAHVATKLQIKQLVNEGREVTIYSTSIPNVKTRLELPSVNFISLRDTKADDLYRRRLLNCLFDLYLTREEKKLKINYTFKGYRKCLDYGRDVLSNTAQVFSKYDVVCVMSEGSIYRAVVSKSEAKKKVQWIHTDYADWRNYNDWTKEITEKDGEIYLNFDYIVVLTKSIAVKFSNIYPELKDKLVVNKNLIPVEEIKKKSLSVQIKNAIPVNFITVGRLGSEKELPRLIEILGKIKQEGYQFTWTIVGDGDLFNYIESLIEKHDLKKEVIMTGALTNPFRKMIEADVFALLSDYEGLPNTIYEALILGIPVLATNVGGIASQIENGITGWLVDNKSDKIEMKIKQLLMEQSQIKDVKNNLKTYKYDNDKIKQTTRFILARSAK